MIFTVTSFCRHGHMWHPATLRYILNPMNIVNIFLIPVNVYLLNTSAEISKRSRYEDIYVHVPSFWNRLELKMCHAKAHKHVMRSIINFIINTKFQLQYLNLLKESAAKKKINIRAAMLCEMLSTKECHKKLENVQFSHFDCTSKYYPATVNAWKWMTACFKITVSTASM